jgi:hypothetical protein
LIVAGIAAVIYLIFGTAWKREAGERVWQPGVAELARLVFWGAVFSYLLGYAG